MVHGLWYNCPMCMKRKKRVAATSDAAIPFAVDRSSAKGLTRQIVEGLRRSIVCGRYRAGDVLPTLSRLAEHLGVSLNVVRAAMRELGQAGYVVSRRRIGSVVQPRGGAVRKGHVLVIQDGLSSSHANALAGEMRRELSRRGYLVTSVAVARKTNGRYDLVPLELELENAVDLAILVLNRPVVERALARAGVPFMIYGDRGRHDACFVGLVRQIADRAIDAVVQECLRHGVSRILMVYAWRVTAGIMERRFRRARLPLACWHIGSSALSSCDEAVQRAGLTAFAARFRREGRGWLPELLIFPDDDFLAAGCLTALLAEGVRVPEDVRVVTLANKGIGPVFVKPLARIESDPGRFAVQITQYADGFLHGGDIPKDAAVHLKYIPGDTFP